MAAREGHQQSVPTLNSPPLTTLLVCQHSPRSTQSVPTSKHLHILVKHDTAILWLIRLFLRSMSKTCADSRIAIGA